MKEVFAEKAVILEEKKSVGVELIKLTQSMNFTPRGGGYQKLAFVSKENDGI